MKDANSRIYNAVCGFLAGNCIGEFMDRAVMRMEETPFDWQELEENQKRIFSLELSRKIPDLMDFYCSKGRRLNPDDFKEFLIALSDKGGLGVTFTNFVERSCVELLKEGMNPRICGLFAPTSADAMLMCLPVALYNYGDEQRAFTDTSYFGNIVGSPEGRDMAVLFGTMICRMISNGYGWEDSKKSLLKEAAQINPVVDQGLRLMFDISEQAKDDADFYQKLFCPELLSKVDTMRNIGLKGYYIAFAIYDYCKGDFKKCMEQGIGWIQKYDAGTRDSWKIRMVVFGSIIGCLESSLHGIDSIPIFIRQSIEQNFDLSERVDAFSALLCKKQTEKEKISKKIGQMVNPGRHEESKLYDKILGGMLAGAIGNVMGSPVENMHYHQIVKQYGVLDTVLQIERFDTEDDCDMAMMWAEAFVDKQGPAMPSDLAAVWMRRMEREKFFACMRNTYDLIKRGMEPHALGHWNIVTGAAVMACAPAGIYNAADPVQAALDARELSYMYQRGMDVEAAVIASAAYAGALSPDATVDSILEAAIAAASDDPMVYFRPHTPDSVRKTLVRALDIAKKYQDVFKVRDELYSTCLEYHPIDPLEVVALSLAVFQVAGGDTEQCMIGGANMGRDSDTIANIAAGLSGFLKGVNSIPQKFLRMAEGKTLKKYEAISMEFTKLIVQRLS